MERVSSGIGTFVAHRYRSQGSGHIPRTVIAEYKGHVFKDKKVADGHSYPTPEKGMEQGIITARAYR